MGSHEKEVEYYNGVSTADVPSAKFGWSEQSKKTLVIAGVGSALFLLAMLFGNHPGNVENIYLVVLAVLVLLGTFLWAKKPGGRQVTRVTARNKPANHQEPDWAELQRNLEGPYAKLSEAELRALNQDPRALGEKGANI